MECTCSAGKLLEQYHTQTVTDMKGQESEGTVLLVLSTNSQFSRIRVFLPALPALSAPCSILTGGSASAQIFLTQMPRVSLT